MSNTLAMQKLVLRLTLNLYIVVHEPKSYSF